MNLSDLENEVGKLVKSLHSEHGLLGKCWSMDRVKSLFDKYRAANTTPSSEKDDMVFNENYYYPDEAVIEVLDNMDLRSAINETIEFLSGTNTATPPDVQILLMMRLKKLIEIELCRAATTQVFTNNPPGEA